MSKKKVKKLLVIGWDAAEWKIIEPLIAAGKMPTLKKFLEEGVSGKIATLDPPFSPMLWTSIATGKRAYDHGIMGFIEPTPDGDGLRPVFSTSRKVKAIWNILNQEGYKSNVIAWWPSHPAEPINGIMVSNFYQTFKDRIDKPWNMPDGTVHPPEMAEIFKDLRVHGDEISLSMIQNFIPKATEIIEKYKPLADNPGENETENSRASNYIKKIGAAVKNLAQCATVHSAGTYAMRNSEWDFMAVYYDTIDHFCHLGMKYHPPRMEDIIDETTFDYYKELVTSAYMFHDMMLERTLNLIDDDTTVIILSDHGFHPDHQRPKFLPMEPASPALEHSPYGFIAIKGPGIKKNERIYGSTLLDITPTILHLFGLPVAKDMEGIVLQDIFEEDKADPIDFIPSWEEVKGEDGRHAPEKIMDTWASKEAMQQLIDLGYIEKPNENMAKAIEDATAEAEYYLARTYIDANKPTEAIKILEDLYQKFPTVVRYSMRLANTYLHNRKYKKCREVLDAVKQLENYPRVKVKHLEGLLYLHTFKVNKGIEILNELKRDHGVSVNILIQLARANNLRNRWEDAQKDFQKVIEMDPSNSTSYHGLGVTYLRRNQLEPALEAFLNAIEINNNLPQAHYHLGETLFKMGLYQQAEQAFLMAIKLKISNIRVHYWMEKIYEKHLINPEKAAFHREITNKHMKKDIIVVTGLKRSGTSLVMEILGELGVDLLVDGHKKPDSNNPRGYFEYEPVENILVDNSWLKLSEGKAVKIHANKLLQLPSSLKYKIIWVDRSINDIVSSFRKMKNKKATTYDPSLASKMTEQVDNAQTWIDAMPNVEMLVVNYNDLVNNTQQEIENMLGFLNLEINPNEVADKIKKLIYNTSEVN